MNKPNVADPASGPAIPKVTPSKVGAAKGAAKNGKTLPQSTVIEQPRVSAKRAQVVAKLNDYVQSVQRGLRFSVDEALGRTVITVVDRKTNEVIRQIPDDIALRLARNLNAFRAEMEMNSLQRRSSTAGGVSLGLVNTRI